MALSRKHFVKAAGRIKKMSTKKKRRKATADFLAVTRTGGRSVGGNPRFDRGRFKKAAGV